MKARAIAAATTLLLAGVLGSCGQGDESRRIAATSVRGRAGFAPDPVTVDKGDKITLTVGNTTDRTHGFRIEGYGVARTVDPGKPIRVVFRADKPGVYKIDCQLHPAHGIASLIVQ